MRRLIGTALVVLAIYAVATQMPDIVRYIKLRSM